MRRSYHTYIKILTKRGTLPANLRKEISRANLYRWRQEPENKYFGLEFTDIQTVENFLSNRHAFAVMRAYLRLIITFVNIVQNSKQFKNVLIENKEGVIKTILRIRPIIGIKHALRLFDISESLFYVWLNQVQNKCTTSVLKLCSRRFPNQLCSIETDTMQNLLTDPKFLHWPVQSVAGYAIRQGLLYVGVSTWYKYLKRLNISRPRKRKLRHKKGIRAVRPHQIWHADVTIFRTLDGIRHYLYLIVDNYSRCILNWRLANCISRTIRMETFKEAYEKYIRPDVREQTLLLVDGGVENCNNEVDSFLVQLDGAILKMVCGRDIDVSNSLVEACNKIIKYNYLFTKEYPDGERLFAALPDIMEDYNQRRPHGSIGFLTPFEALNNIALDREAILQGFELARQLRILQNTSQSCGVCE